jgi:hypothetical protein
LARELIAPTASGLATVKPFLTLELLRFAEGSTESEVGVLKRRAVEETGFFSVFFSDFSSAMSTHRLRLFWMFSQVAVVCHLGVASPTPTARFT